jgi:H+/Cl- antiporter ClcA
VVVLMTVDRSWKINQLRRKHYFINAFFFGLIVALIGYYTRGYSFGNGASSVRLFLDHNSSSPWYFALSKFLGATASVSAFVPGGYFSTALSIGAGIGDLFQKIMPINLPLVQFYLLGMVGFLAAITQAPVTAIAMVVEISNSGEFTLPILVSAIIASYIAEIFGDSVYHLQALNYIDKERYNETR